MASPEYERFYKSFVDDRSASVTQGLDVRALTALRDEERARAEGMLLTRLDAVGDSRAVIGLDALRSTRAQPGLERLYQSTRGEALGSQGLKLVLVCAALWHLSPDARWLDAVLDVLRRSTIDATRRAAAEALREFDHDDARSGLIEALDADDMMVRHAAAKALLTMRCVAFDTNDNRHAIYRVMSPDAKVRAAARHEVVALIGASASPTG